MSMIAKDTLPRRYPGLKPFERNQSTVFHGRKEDIQRLTNLVMRERLVVLSSKSGIGKTSLLQAGVAPELEKQDFVPVFFRTDKTDAPLLDTVRMVLEKCPYVSRRDDTDENPQKTPTLWELMKRLEFDLNGMPATPVLIFDQFEELFTLAHSNESRGRFVKQLADLANETMPDSLRNDLQNRYQAGEMSLETMKWWETQPDLRIVFSLRSDFLYLIEELSERLPDIKRNGYQLLPLNREQARIAIVQPGLVEGEFASLPFEYNEAALTQIIDFLCGQQSDEHHLQDTTQVHKRREEVESVNLQIVCRDIEEKIIASSQPECFVVEPSFYNGLEGLRVSLSNFYHNQLMAFPAAYMERMLNKAQQNEQLSPEDLRLKGLSKAELTDIAQKLIEESLVTPGDRRNSVVDDTLLDSYHISPDFLNTLVDRSRLLRKEPRLDDFYYEISHDTLLPAIIESRNERRSQERLKAEAEIRQKEREKEQEQVRLAFPAAYMERMLNKAQQNEQLSPEDLRLKGLSKAELTDIAQKLIEESLVTPGDRRNSVVDDTLLDSYHISPDFLNTLVDRSRLLRKEPRLDDFYYEISHDTLLPAIIESRNERRSQERLKAEAEIRQKEREKEQEQVRLMQAELKQLKERRKLARWAAISSLISMLLMVALVGYFISNYISDVNQIFTQAEENVRNEQFDAATVTFNDFKQKWRRRLVINYLHTPSKSVYEEAQVMEMFHAKYDSIVYFLRLGDSLFFSRGKLPLYSPALSAYHTARSVVTRYDSLNHQYPHVKGTEPPYRIAPNRIMEWQSSLDLRIQNSLETIITRYTINQRALESYEEALAWGQVRRNLLEMKQLLPVEPVYLDSLCRRLGIEGRAADLGRGIDVRLEGLRK